MVITFLAFVSALPLLREAEAQTNLVRIAAVVNDDIISVLDLEQRLRLVALSSNLRLDDQTRQRLAPQVLRGLIDERLQFQEAKSNGITVTDREIDQEVANLAERNNIPAVQFAAFLASQGVDIQTLRTQLRAQISWAKYAGRHLSRQIEIGEDEIDEELERLRTVADQPRKRIAEIFLGIDNPDETRTILQNAQRLLAQIRGGANFAALARSFSESGSAAVGGDLGWIAPGQLSPELDAAIANLSPGMVSEPIQTIAGFYLLAVVDTRTPGINPGAATISLVQLTRRVPQDGGDAVRSAALAAVNETRQQIDGCATAQSLGQTLADTNVAAADGVRQGDLPGPVQQAVAGLSAGQTTVPIDTGNAIVLVTICSREEAGIQLPTREQIEERIGTTKLELLVRRKLRDLRREAFIDIRL